MKIILDTVNKDFYCALIKEDILIDSILIENEKHKVELIPKTLNLLLEKYFLNIQDIKSFYINIGPGSFTGCRISLVFCRTIAKIINSNLFTINNFEWLAGPFGKNKINIDARNNENFSAIVENGKLISKIETISNENSSKMDYQKFEKNIPEYLKLFKQANNIDEIFPFYFKEPKIGGK